MKFVIWWAKLRSVICILCYVLYLFHWWGIRVARWRDLVWHIDLEPKDTLGEGLQSVMNFEHRSSTRLLNLRNYSEYNKTISPLQSCIWMYCTWNCRKLCLKLILCWKRKDKKNNVLWMFLNVSELVSASLCFISRAIEKKTSYTFRFVFALCKHMHNKPR